MSNISRLHATILVVLLIASCRVNMDPVIHPGFSSAGDLEPKVTRLAILAGVGVAGWRVVREVSNKITAQMAYKGHSVVVDISYSESGYTIDLKKASQGFDYDGEVVHKRYSYWVKHLNEEIIKQVRTHVMPPHHTSGTSSLNAPDERADNPSVSITDQDGNGIRAQSRNGEKPKHPAPGTNSLSDEASRELMLSSRVAPIALLNRFSDFSKVAWSMFSIPVACKGRVCEREIKNPYPELGLDLTMIHRGSIQNIQNTEQSAVLSGVDI